MSEEKVELARQYIEIFNRGGLDAARPLWHPEIEAFDPPTFPDAGHHVGPEAVLKLVESYLEIGWDGQFHAPEFIDAGDEVLVIWEFRGQSGHGGGFPLEGTISHIYGFQDGKLRRIRQFMGREEGLEAVGLSR